jgi:hypothetical protein
VDFNAIFNVVVIVAFSRRCITIPLRLGVTINMIGLRRRLMEAVDGLE